MNYPIAFVLGYMQFKFQQTAQINAEVINI